MNTGSGEGLCLGFQEFRQLLLQAFLWLVQLLGGGVTVVGSGFETASTKAQFPRVEEFHFSLACESAGWERLEEMGQFYSVDLGPPPPPHLVASPIRRCWPSPWV